MSSDAVIVLPYDPVNDRILLVKQFRTGPYVKGDANPWVLEPIAGLIDVGETPVEAGLREAKEEAHLEINIWNWLRAVILLLAYQMNFFINILAWYLCQKALT